MDDNQAKSALVQKGRQETSAELDQVCIYTCVYVCVYMCIWVQKGRQETSAELDQVSVHMCVCMSQSMYGCIPLTKHPNNDLLFLRPNPN